MNIVDKINQNELNKHRGNKDLSKIPLKSFVSVKYQTATKDTRIFRGIVIEKVNKGISSSISILKTDANAGKRMTYKFLYYSPNLVDVSVDRLCTKKPRRAKLFYMKERYGKKARI